MMSESGNEGRIKELKRQLAWAEELRKNPWAFKGDGDAKQDNEESIANLKAEISRIGG